MRMTPGGLMPAGGLALVFYPWDKLGMRQGRREKGSSLPARTKRVVSSSRRGAASHPSGSRGVKPSSTRRMLGPARPASAASRSVSGGQNRSWTTRVSPRSSATAAHRRSGRYRTQSFRKDPQ